MPTLSKPSHMELLAPADVSSDVVYNLESSQEPSEAPSKQASLHCAASELGSRADYEGDQSSPISVIESPFADHLSSGSECFESISADLHGLRMQLQLLKLETESYEEGTILLSSNDDVEDDRVSMGFAENKVIAMAEKNLESVYIVDVLVDSGINGTDLDTFLATRHSLECPLNPLIFEELERKYHHLNSWLRAERRLSFDRINNSFQPHMDQKLPWMKVVRKRTPKWNIRELEDNLHKSLVGQKNKKPDMDAGECEWSNLKDDIDVIGKEIEILLVDELVAEVVKSLSSSPTRGD